MYILLLAKQSPSQSPALNNAHFAGNTVSSPVIGNSPHMAGARIGSDYAGKFSFYGFILKARY